MIERSERPVLAVMGPTASGKTRLAIQLARVLCGEIISVDSSLVYRAMDIGTAKPSLPERAEIPHHLIDILDPSESFSTGQFRSEALRLVEDILARGRLPILAGGTMLYFNALFHGLAELPPADPDVRREIDREAERLGWAELHQQLRKVDPNSAARIHPNDPQRIQRALEVYRLTSVPLSEHCARQTRDPPAFQPVKVIVAPTSRAVLHERIRVRFLQMIDQGFEDEVRALFERGDLDESFPAIRAVGYRQMWGYLLGEYGWHGMLQRGIAATRQFAKRQYTWLRRERDALSHFSEDPELLEHVLRELRAGEFYGLAMAQRRSL